MFHKTTFSPHSIPGMIIFFAFAQIAAKAQNRGRFDYVFNPCNEKYLKLHLLQPNLKKFIFTAVGQLKMITFAGRIKAAKSFKNQ